MSERAIPMLDDLPLDLVTAVRQRTVIRTQSLPVPGLDGDVQQVQGRASHEIELRGVIAGAESADQLRSLQEKVAAGEEVAFSADITTALELDRVIVVASEFEEIGGRPGCYQYYLRLRESPPLPPPAELSSFGGLGGPDLGFDTDVLGDIADVADQLQDAVDQVTSALDALQSLAGLADLALGNPLTPFQEEASRVGESAAGGGDAASGLQQLIGGGGS